MLVIRFQRRGKKNRPFFKIVVAKKESPPKGKFLEAVGSYDPLTKEKIINKERVLFWVEHGAQVSSSAHNLFVREHIIEAAKTRAHSSRLRKKKEKKIFRAESGKEQAEKTVSSEEVPKPEEITATDEEKDISKGKSQGVKLKEKKEEITEEVKETEVKDSKKKTGTKKLKDEPLTKTEEVNPREADKKEAQDKKRKFKEKP